MLKRSVMILYSGPLNVASQQVRIVLAEKGVSVDIINMDPENPSADLKELNPYNTLPTLVDRDLVLYHPRIIMEYLDERFPHPPLLPVYPVSRSKSRLMMHRIERDWYGLMRKIESGEDVKQSRHALVEEITALNPVFAQMPYFLSEEFTLVDCVLGPLLWHFPRLGIELHPKKAANVLAYAERVFARESFQASMSEQEREIRDAIDDLK
ncbi:MAG: stringent starvation protein A [Gammaproteobacteria bacterium RIFCSPHIGHO2_12_FULL_41_15]|nr:MAG: stringent starvation protein A [Gammaproteobacteria bacterium RIFCSPHIGHO2_12_FULL_41_15]